MTGVWKNTYRNRTVLYVMGALNVVQQILATNIIWGMLQIKGKKKKKKKKYKLETGDNTRLVWLVCPKSLMCNHRLADWLATIAPAKSESK